MCRIFFFSLMVMQCVFSYGQSECNRLVVKVKKPFQSTIYQSDSSLTFTLGGDVIGKLLISDAGLRETIHFDFTFTDKQGRPVETNDLLTIRFNDMKAEFIARSKRPYNGKIIFAIVRQTETRLGTRLTDDDALFYNKLKSNLITYFDLTVGGQNHKIHLSRVQAEWLKKVITCLSKRQKF